MYLLAYYSGSILLRRPFPTPPLFPPISLRVLPLAHALQFYDGLPRCACEVIATDFSVRTLLMTASAPESPTLKPQGRIEFSVGGLALVSFFSRDPDD